MSGVQIVGWFVGLVVCVKLMVVDFGFFFSSFFSGETMTELGVGVFVLDLCSSFLLFCSKRPPFQVF